MFRTFIAFHRERNIEILNYGCIVNINVKLLEPTVPVYKERIVANV